MVKVSIAVRLRILRCKYAPHVALVGLTLIKICVGYLPLVVVGCFSDIQDT